MNSPELISQRRPAISDQPFPITATTLMEIIRQTQKLFDDLYQDRIGGALLGDVFEIGVDDVFALNHLDEGLTKSGNQLAIRNKTTGGLHQTADGEMIKCKPFGGCATDADGLYITTEGSAGEIAGLKVTIKDADELYVWGGHIEINGLLYQANAQITVDASGLTADTLYYLYVDAAVSGSSLAAGDFTLSTTAPAYDHTKGAYYKTGDGTKRWLANAHTSAGGAVRGIFAAGRVSIDWKDIIDYVTIATTGNATDFGDLTAARARIAACASSTRAILGIGKSGVTGADYITIATTGNAATFGNPTVDRDYAAGAASETRGVFAGGHNGSSTLYNTIDYFTIATLGNAVDFGDLTLARLGFAGLASHTRAVFAGGSTGWGSGVDNTIDYVTIASTGNATDFGNLTESRWATSGASSPTRGIISGGQTTGGGSDYSLTIDYITIASTGDAADFGDLTVAGIAGLAATSSNVRGIAGGGVSLLRVANVIDYVTIATTGNAVDFGDLTLGRTELTSTSNGHGGVDGPGSVISIAQMLGNLIRLRTNVDNIPGD